MKQNIYDDKHFGKAYDIMRKEEKGHNANDVIEIPIFRKMIGNVKNKSILDLGCGYGENDKYFKEKGASSILGIDISKHMIEIANKENKIEGVSYKLLPMEDINTIDNKFDIVISSLAFHYVENYDKLIKDISLLLNKNGTILFSIEHPINLSFIQTNELEKNKIIINNRQYRLLADYNREGLRENKWNDTIVKKYYRSFSTTINTLIKHGFIIDEINECKPNEEMINKNPKYINQYDCPYFLFVKAHKKEI